MWSAMHIPNREGPIYPVKIIEVRQAQLLKWFLLRRLTTYEHIVLELRVTNPSPLGIRLLPIDYVIKNL